MSQGIRIAKESQTVKDDSEAQYVDTTTPVFKLYLQDKGERLYTTTANENFTIPHNLGYRPMFFLYADRAHLDARKLVLSGDAQYPENSVYVTCTVDTKNINVTVSDGGVPPTLPITIGYNYLIFYDKAG